MRLAIMQPYFLPYIGYFQLMSAVDKFILLDDVNFINRGWINRNRIAVNGEPYWMTLPLIKASQNRLINEIEIFDDLSWKRKILRTVELSYRQAPHFAQVFPLFSEMVETARGPLDAFLADHLAHMTAYVGLDVRIEKTSGVYPKEGLTGQDRILDICRREQADSYFNLPGGRDLYDPATFSAVGVELLFIDPNFEAMRLHHGGKEGPYLSILDLVMFNSAATVRDAIALCRAVPRLSNTN
jgi:hypothetical protein